MPDTPLRKQHRWSGWPGAYCFDCGATDGLEQAIADGWYDPIADTWDSEAHRLEIVAGWRCKALFMPDAVCRVCVRGMDPTADVHYVGRACYGWPRSPLGNPFKLRDERYRVPVVSQYKKWLAMQLLAPESKQSAEVDRLAQLLIANVYSLTLGCWCGIAATPCHADVVAEAVLARANALLLVQKQAP